MASFTKKLGYVQELTVQGSDPSQTPASGAKLLYFKGSTLYSKDSSGTVKVAIAPADLINDSGSDSSTIWSASKVTTQINASAATSAAGLVNKGIARTISTSNLTATYSNGSSGVGATLTSTSNGAFPAVNGVTITSSNAVPKILVNAQTNPEENGLYDLTTTGNGSTPWVLTRSTNFDTASEIKPNSTIAITEGTYADSEYWLKDINAEDTVTVGTTGLAFTAKPGTTYTAGNGLDLTGSTLSVNVDNSSIEISADTLQVKDGGITAAKIGSGAVTASKLGNSYVDDFVSGDFSSNVLTYAAATHGLGASKNIMVAVYQDGSPNVAVDVLVTVADNGDVTVSSDFTFDGNIIITRAA